MDMAMLVLKTQTNLTNYGWTPPHEPHKNEHPLPPPQHHTQMGLEEFGFDIPEEKEGGKMPSIENISELTDHMNEEGLKLGLKGMSGGFSNFKREIVETLENMKEEYSTSLPMATWVSDPTIGHLLADDEKEKLTKLTALLNQVNTIQNLPSTSLTIDPTKEATQTILGQHHPSLPGPYSDEPINMLRVIPRKLRESTFQDPETGEERTRHNFKTRPGILAHGMPLVNQTKGNKRFEFFGEGNSPAFSNRPFPLGEGGSFYVPNNMRDLSNIATGADMEDSTLWGVRGLQPQQIDALMRGANESTENLNEILVREKIDPHRLVDLSTSAAMKYRGRPGLSLEHDIGEYRQIGRAPLSRLFSQTGPDGKQLPTSTGETINERIENFRQNSQNEEHPDYGLERPGAVRHNILDEFKHLPAVRNALGRDVKQITYGARGTEPRDEQTRMLFDIARDAGMSRYATSNENVPMNENFWPLNPQGEPMSLEELELAYKPMLNALQSSRLLHQSGRPPEWGTPGEEQVLQPPTGKELAHLFYGDSDGTTVSANGNLIDSRAEEGDPLNFHNFYSNVEAMNALRQMRGEDATV